MLRLPILTGAAFMLLAGGAVAQQPQPLNGTEGGTSNQYWTGQRMMNAKPAPMPPMNGAAVTPHAQMPRSQAQAGAEQEGQPGSPPTVPDSETEGMAVRLYGAETQEQWKELSTAEGEEEPDAKSRFGFPFTTAEVTPNDAHTTYPWRAAGQLFFTEQGVGDFVCSGSTIRPGIVVVAGHCVAAPAAGNVPAHYFTHFLFVPAAQNGTGPFGKWTPSFVIATHEWLTGGGTVPNAQDVGMFAMNEANGRRIGDVVGWYGWRTNSLPGQHVTMLGYPCNLDNCQKMIRTDAGDSVFGGNNTYEYGSASSGGASGGPWVMDFGIAPTNTGANQTPLGGNILIAVTSYGPSGTNGFLGASNPNSSFVQIMNALCKADPSACSN